MFHLTKPARRPSPWRGILALSLLTFLGLSLPSVPFVDAQQGKPAPAAKKEAAAALPSGVISPAMWRQPSATPLRPGEIDRLVSAELARARIKPAPRTTDEQFLRRVWLDVTGALPMPADVDDFLKDTRPDKRARVIDKLLDSKAYTRHWARYWREVISARVVDQLALVSAGAFEKWMEEQLQANRSWADIVRAMLTATGEVRFAEPDKNGVAFFLMSRRGADAVTERAAETSRVFLGIQIQCAQCHDHPSDVWKRPQFHEFAAHFARVRERPIFEEKRIKGLRLVSMGFGEYQMPGKDDPKKRTVTHPRFLDGSSPGMRLTDLKRRSALADSITSKDNPWFAAAFVNRIWGELLGQSFYQPVDDLGPQKEAVFPTVLTRVASSFRGSNHDIKALFRAILNSETYQRQIRIGESTDEHLMFASVYPTRLPADSLWKSLTGALGQMGGPGAFGRRPMGPFGRFFGLEGQFRQEFGYDPSSRPEEVEGSVSQALLLMNNPQINQKIRATGTNLLARILSTYSDDGEALRMLYLRALARRPTDREMARCRQHIATAGSRAEGFEDVLWALINSTEFQTKR
jgi:hypothetical protein